MSQSVTTITPPTELAVSVAHQKTHMRLAGDDGSHDGYIADLIAATTGFIESEINRSLVTRTLELGLDGFPLRLAGEVGVIHLPRPPIVAVESIQYLDPQGQLRTLDAESYQADVAHQPGRVATAGDLRWPETSRKPRAVRIRYTAGHGDAEQVPQMLKAAILLLVTHWYDNPSAVSESSLREVPLTVERIICQHRMPEVL